jgi:hypothetical protein
MLTRWLSRKGWYGWGMYHAWPKPQQKTYRSKWEDYVKMNNRVINFQKILTGFYFLRIFISCRLLWTKWGIFMSHKCMKFLCRSVTIHYATNPLHEEVICHFLFIPRFLVSGDLQCIGNLLCSVSLLTIKMTNSLLSDVETFWLMHMSTKMSLLTSYSST